MTVEGVQSLFLASQIQKEHSIEDLLNFLIVFLIRVLKQHQTDLEQYLLAPTYTGKSSTHQTLNSMIVFKAKHLLILILCQHSIFKYISGNILKICF